MKKTKILSEHTGRKWIRAILIAAIAIIGFLALSKGPEATSAADSSKAACQSCGKAESCSASKTRTP